MSHFESQIHYLMATEAAEKSGDPSYNNGTRRVPPTPTVGEYDNFRDEEAAYPLYRGEFRCDQPYN